MSLWNKSSKFPQNLNRQQKRNVVVTDKGFVRRITYKDAQNVNRVKDELLVTISGLANSSNFGSPNVVDVWFTRSTGTVNTAIETWISFDEPITSTTTAKITIANTAGGASTYVATTPNTAVYDTNKLRFTWTPLVAGTYKVGAQTIANATSSALNIRSRNTGTETATLTISSSISNSSFITIS